MKKQNGITLVSLVITIIIMLILAGISLSMVMGENSVLEQAKTAVDETENSEEIERTEMTVLGSFGSNGKYDSDKAFEGIKKNYNLTGATTTTNASGAKVVTGVNSKTGENITLTQNTDGSIKVETKDYTLAFDGRGKVTEKNKLNGSLAGGGNTPAPAPEVNPNSFGFHFNKKYNALVDGAKTTLIFQEDTSAKMFVNEVLNMEIPIGMIIYDTKKIDLSAIGYGVGIVSDDGKQININGMLFVLEEQIDTSTLGKKYFIPGEMGGYFIISDDNTVHIFDNSNVRIGTIASNNVSVSGYKIVVSGNTGYDGNYEYNNNKQFITAVSEEYNEANIIGFDETYVCTHKKRTDLNGRTDTRNYWRSFYDENNNYVSLYDIERVSDLNKYTLRCDACMKEIEWVQQGNYIYLYNSWMEPQRKNGNLLENVCVDIDDEEIGGWAAIPFDCAKIDGVQNYIKGQPVTTLYFYNNMVIPKHTKYMLTWGYIFGANESDEPKAYTATYEGTINEFKQIKRSNYTDESFEQDLKSVCKNISKVTSLTIKCKDGDLVIK